MLVRVQHQTEATMFLANCAHTGHSWIAGEAIFKTYQNMEHKDM
jgi:hypothetical protein